MVQNLNRDIKVTRIANASAAGTSAVNSASINMAGFDSVMFITEFGAITSGGVQSVNIATSSNNSDWNDLLATSITVADDDGDKITVHDIVKPLEQYLRVEVAKATQNSVVEGILAIQYNARKKPADDDSSTVVDSETHVSPIEGTA